MILHNEDGTLLNGVGSLPALTACPTKDEDHWGKALTLQPGLQLYCVEWEASRSAAFEFQRNFACLEFGCLLSGQVRGNATVSEGEAQELDEAAGSAWCCCHNCAHGTFEYLAGQPLCAIYFLAYGAALEGLTSTTMSLNSRGPSSPKMRPFNKTTALTPSVCTVAQQIMQAARQPHTSNRLFLISKAYELLFHLSNQEDDALHDMPERGKLSGVALAQEILDNNLTTPPSLNTIARESGLCVTSLTEEFKKHFGTTVFGYLRRKRLSRAKELIEDQRMSASEAAWAVGYSSLSSFHRAFSSQFGVSPGSLSRKKPALQGNKSLRHAV
jgi:AraC-like DNA-binding protein